MGRFQIQRAIRGRLWVVVAFVLAAAALTGGWQYRQHQRYKHLVVHQPGMVYRSAWLEPDVLSDVIETYQIRAVINLCKPGEMGEQRWIDERHAVANAGARLIELEMPTSVDPADPAIEKHLQVMSDPDNYPMLVHCQHGVTRTAKHLAIYDIVFRGLTGDQSLAAQPKFGRDDHNVNVRAFVRSFEQQRHKLYPTAYADNLKILAR
ncbi:MAG: hypothetical protein WD648_13550 [Planctomycetaceae bacterium]